MGSNIYSDGKLQFYPTNYQETLRMLPFVANVNTKRHMTDEIKKDIGEDTYRSLYDNKHSGISMDNTLYDYFLTKKQYNKLNQYFTIYYGTCLNDDCFTICDYFAGEGTWLDIFKNSMPLDLDNDMYLIANELEQGRYNIITENKNIDEYTNLAFEDTQYPKYHASLVLYNPPYGETNGVRNAEHYLKMILDRKLIYNNQEKVNSKCGSIICVLRGDDILDCAELLSSNFLIKYESIYKVHKEEFDKYKQYVLFAELRREPLDPKNRFDASMIQESIAKLQDIILNKQPEFNIDMYMHTSYRHLSLNQVNYKNIKENFTYVQNTDKYISKDDGVWKWIKDTTLLKDIGTEKITIGKKAKQGEIANFISSGYINSELSLPNGIGKHIVVGGTKSLTRKETHKEKDDKGDSYEVTEVVKYTQPYINILCNKDDKLQIIELGSGEIE